MRADAAVDLVPLPDEGRVHLVADRARIGDCGPDGLLRLDGLARLLQDVADADTVDAGGGSSWVVRRTLVEVRRAPALREALEVRTFCGGLGRRWAERRTSVRGERGAEVEAASLWVHVDPATGRPAPLPAAFVALHAPAAGGREVRARLRHGGEVAAEAVRRPWPVRAVDLDVVGHVNNAVGWAVVEEALAAVGRAAAGHRRVRAEVEHRRSVEAGDDVAVAWWPSPAAEEGAGAGAGGLSLVLADAAALASAATGGTLPTEDVRLTARVAPLAR